MGPMVYKLSRLVPEHELCSLSGPEDLLDFPASPGMGYAQHTSRSPLPDSSGDATTSSNGVPTVSGWYPSAIKPGLSRQPGKPATVSPISTQ